MFKSKRNQIKNTILLMILFATTYQVYGGINIIQALGIIKPIEVAAETISKDINIKTKEDNSTKALFAKIDSLNATLDEQLAVADKINEKYDELMTPKVIPETHAEDCLSGNCRILSCLSNYHTKADYHYNDITAVEFDSNGNPIYGGDAVRNLNVNAIEFIKMIAPLAKEAQKQFGIPASTIIAQAGLETGWGKHIIGNNLFGIKATDSYQGPTVYVNTKEYSGDDGYHTVARFRGYHNIGEAVYDYAKNVIQSNPNMYSGVITDSWVDSVYGLGCYATDPNYFDLIIKVINDFNLTKFN